MISRIIKRILFFYFGNSKIFQKIPRFIGKFRSAIAKQNSCIFFSIELHYKKKFDLIHFRIFIDKYIEKLLFYNLRRCKRIQSYFNNNYYPTIGKWLKITQENISHFQSSKIKILYFVVFNYYFQKGKLCFCKGKFSSHRD